MNNNRIGRRRIVFLAFLLIFLAGVGVAYANKDALINHYYLITGSPLEYYTHLEKYGLYELLSTLPDEAPAISEAYAYDLASNVILHKRELNSVLNTITGFGLTDLEELLGVSLDTIGFNAFVTSKDNILSERISIELNNTKLITSELFLDSTSHMLSLRFPELSDAYLTGSFPEGEASAHTYEQQQELLSSATAERVVRRYLELYFSHLGQVTLERSVPLSPDKTLIECNLLTVTFTVEEFEEFGLTLLEAARSDEDIFSLLPLLHMTKEQYLRMLDQIEGIIKGRYSGSDQDALLQMKLYADQKGHILRRELTSFGGSSFGYTMLAQKECLEYELHLTHSSTKSKLQINGNNRRIDEGNQGAITILATAPTLVPDSDITLDINYEDVRRLLLNNRTYLEGDFTLSSGQLAGILITSEFDLQDNHQLNTTAIRLGASPLITINSTMGFLEDFNVSVPESDAVHYEFSNYKEYLSTIDLNRYWLSLSDILNLDPGAMSLDTDALLELFE